MRLKPKHYGHQFIIYVLHMLRATKFVAFFTKELLSEKYYNTIFVCKVNTIGRKKINTMETTTVFFFFFYSIRPFWFNTTD